MTPFEALYGRRHQIIPRYEAGSTPIQALDEVLRDRDALLKQLKEILRQSQFRMEQQANRHRRDLEFQVGDKVLVKLQPYRQSSLRGRQAPKLAQRYYGPFTVTARIGQVAYRLDLPSESRIHPVFHISKLRPFRGSDIHVVCSLTEGSSELSPAHEPLAICGQRSILTRSGPQQQVLVQWKGEPPECATWEAAAVVQGVFPNFNLEDKVGLEGVESVTPLDQAAEATQIVKEAQLGTRPIRAKKMPTRYEDFVISK